MANESVPLNHVVDAVIESKKEHIDAAVAPSLERPEARQVAYKRIIEAAKTGMEHYYHQFPERAIDARSLDAETWSLNGLRAIFAILDEYAISYLDERNTTMSTTQQPPQPTGQHQSQFASIMENVYKYTGLAASAVLQAQQEGVGQSGQTKSQMALSIVHAGLKGAGLFVPGVAGLAIAEPQLEPIFVPLFTSLVNLFRHQGHPAFQQAPSPTP